MLLERREVALDERGRFDAGDHLEPPAAATTVLDIDGEHALEPLRPCHADMLGNSGGPLRRAQRGVPVFAMVPPSVSEPDGST